jgi:hypothetical protein
MVYETAAPTLPSWIAMPWFRREDWNRWRMLLADGHRLPPDFQVWEFRSETMRSRLKREGRRVDRIFLEPEIFSGWCRARNLVPNADAGWRFAAEIGATGH